VAAGHLLERHGLQVMKHSHPTLRSLRREHRLPSLHGTQVWRSSYLLMEYLWANPIADGQRVMELGCGWGLLGIFCAKHFDAQVLLTDADPRVLPYAETHAQLNQVQVQTQEVCFGAIPAGCLRQHDILIGADICFWPELTTRLRRLFERAILEEVGMILVADPGRSTFFRLAEHCQRNFGASVIDLKTPRRTGTDAHLLIIGDPHPGG
jgi:predicted nicotinamide N-methyase